MSFLVLPPEVNSAQMFAGAGSDPMLAAAAAWDGISTELAGAADTFSAVTTGLLADAWQGPTAALMNAATAPYAGWLGAAAVEAETSASQARAAMMAFETARSTMVNPALVAANRNQLVALVRSNLLGFNAPAIAATEAAYEDMWAQAVSVMAGYHTSTSAAVAQLGSWEQILQSIAGLPGRLATAIANAPVVVQQQIAQTSNAVSTAITQAANTATTDIFGSPAGPPIPATQNPTFTGTPSLATRVEVQFLQAVKDVANYFGYDIATQGASLISSTSPPKLLTWLLGENVTQSTYDGMSVIQIAPAHPSGFYVVAIHGGAYEVQPTILHWLDYSLMAYQTGATVEVPLYPLVQQGGTASTVIPEMAGFISTQIAAHGAPYVSVYGDSAGGGIALSAVEYMVANNETVPASMVLLSPSLEVALTNPNISLVNDPFLNLGSLQQAGRAWAGNLPEDNYLVSPLYGSLQGLPPTYVYSGSLDTLGPDVLVLAQEAAAQGAPISFVLRAGEIHDWALAGLGDGAAYRSQIYQELGI